MNFLGHETHYSRISTTIFDNFEDTFWKFFYGNDHICRMYKYILLYHFMQWFFFSLRINYYLSHKFLLYINVVFNKDCVEYIFLQLIHVLNYNMHF